MAEKCLVCGNERDEVHSTGKFQFERERKRGVFFPVPCHFLCKSRYIRYGIACILGQPILSGSLLYVGGGEGRRMDLLSVPCIPSISSFPQNALVSIKKTT